MAIVSRALLVAALSTGCAYHPPTAPTPEPMPPVVASPTAPAPTTNPRVPEPPPYPVPPTGPTVPSPPPIQPPPVYQPPAMPFAVTLGWQTTVTADALLVNFSFSESGASGRIMRVTYEFGDGESLAIDATQTHGLTAFHRYATTVGPYEAKVTLQDAAGRTATDREWVTLR